ncbi:rRNA maturation RNase YbeY [Patescibacteria group bacterium]|nr:rRNA maturation RNase YbeY [Patescibacteria group bacterium]MBU1721891.1 rRNA maturation RNase YbeY [Patescibacteria group bacterium]MBU1900877.1 rRNA maturation RNase YbeY [Patescibacteria group bacterium]
MISIYSTVKKKGVSEKTIKELVSFILKQSKVHGDVSVHFIGDTKMKRLNKQYRGKEYSTDVLSFAQQEGEWITPTEDLGDIFISVPYIRAQAKRFDVSYREESMRMLVHGLLHLLGHDHQKEKEAQQMYQLQEQYIKKFL